MCAVATGPGRHIEHKKFAIFDAFHALFDKLQFRGIEHVIGGIDGCHRCFDFFQVRIRVVIPRSVKIVKHIVGICCLEMAGNVFGKRGVRLIARGSVFLQLESAASHEEQDIQRACQPSGLGLVFAIVPAWISTNRIHDHLEHDAAPSAYLYRHAGQRHESAREIRMLLSPQPCMHAAHGGAYNQAKMI